MAADAPLLAPFATGGNRHIFRPTIAPTAAVELPQKQTKNGKGTASAVPPSRKSRSRPRRDDTPKQRSSQGLEADPPLAPSRKSERVASHSMWMRRRLRGVQKDAQCGVAVYGADVALAVVGEIGHDQLRRVMALGGKLNSGLKRTVAVA